MALINDTYIFVKSEDVSRDMEISSHPVEEGIDLTDCVRRSPLSLSLSGELVGSDYEDVISELESLQKSGELVEYIGVNIVSDVIVTKFSTTHTGEIRGGCEFSMELKEVRIASSPFASGNGNSGSQQIDEPPGDSSEKTHTVKSGETLWKIAQSYYGNGAQYTVIFNANRNKISDPNRINVGQVLVIP